MRPYNVDETIAKDTLLAWFAESGELAIEAYKPYSGGGGDFYILTSYSQFEDLVKKARPVFFLFILRERPYPMRGVVDAHFMAEALERFAGGDRFEIIAPCTYPNMISFLSDGGKGHAELKAELESLSGRAVWVGAELKMPDGDYWGENTMADALVAIKPEAA